jgi:hypothetical protein
MFLHQCLIPKGVASKKAAVCFVPTGRFKAGRIFLYQYLIPKGIVNTKMREFFPILNPYCERRICQLVFIVTLGKKNESKK